MPTWFHELFGFEECSQSRVPEGGARHAIFAEELLAGVRRGNLHEEVDTGSPEGREIW